MPKCSCGKHRLPMSHRFLSPVNMNQQDERYLKRSPKQQCMTPGGNEDRRSGSRGYFIGSAKAWVQYAISGDRGYMSEGPGRISSDWDVHVPD